MVLHQTIIGERDDGRKLQNIVGCTKTYSPITFRVERFEFTARLALEITQVISYLSGVIGFFFVQHHHAHAIPLLLLLLLLLAAALFENLHEIVKRFEILVNTRETNIGDFVSLG